jgi:hypothetical protein
VRTGRGNLTLAAVVIVGATSCGSTATAKATPTQSSLSPTPAIDPCLVGTTWMIQTLDGLTFYVTWAEQSKVLGHESVSIGGGAGMVTRYARDGSFRDDYGNASPFRGITKDGESETVIFRGYEMGKIRTLQDSRFVIVAADLSHLTQATQLNTQTFTPTTPIQQAQGDTPPPQPGSDTGYYHCDGQQLTLDYDSGPVYRYTHTGGGSG